MKRINSNELLPAGTEVFVKNQKGTVLSSEMVKASNFGMICSHTISFTHVHKSRTAGKSPWVALEKPETRGVNYAFIYFK